MCWHHHSEHFLSSTLCVQYIRHKAFVFRNIGHWSPVGHWLPVGHWTQVRHWLTVGH